MIARISGYILDCLVDCLLQEILSIHLQNACKIFRTFDILECIHNIYMAVNIYIYTNQIKQNQIKVLYHLINDKKSHNCFTKYAPSLQTSQSEQNNAFFIHFLNGHFLVHYKHISMVTKLHNCIYPQIQITYISIHL